MNNNESPGQQIRGLGVDGFAIERAVSVATFKSHFATLDARSSALAPPLGFERGAPLALDAIREKSLFEIAEERIRVGLSELRSAQVTPSTAKRGRRKSTTTTPVSTNAPPLNFAQLTRSNSMVGMSELRRVSSMNVLPFAPPPTTVVILPPTATQWAADELANSAKRTKKKPTVDSAAAEAAAEADTSTAAATMNVQVVRQSDALHKSELDALLRAMGDPNDRSDVVAEREVLLTVVLMQPNKDVRMVEVDVLATQPLSALVDAFDCPSSRNAIALPGCRNQCMYIEGTFYDDTRHADAVRYSEPLVQWLRECGGRVAPCVDIVSCAEARVANMQDTRIIDMALRLHAPYLYVHQGDCAHVFAFQAMRIACNVDPPRRSAYPRVVLQEMPRERRCAICELYPAKYVTVADKWAPADPCLFCERCYAPLHYDEKGDLLPNWAHFGGAEFVQDFAVS
jgi:snRNA-activating protein complex subunit 3